MAGAYAAAMHLLRTGPAFTAIFVHNDVMAVGVLRALYDCQLRVPQDCSVVSCDDLDVGAFLVPSLTSVHVPFAETGARAAALLIQLIRGENTPAYELSPTHLVVRQSTAPPPPAASKAGRTGPVHDQGKGDR
jgi:LacI family transcriptional regulator